MPHDRSEVHLAADLSAQQAQQAQPARELEVGPFRVVIFGEFGGRANASPLAMRRMWRVDRDDVDTVLSKIAPELRVTLDPSEPPLAIAFAALDDFHPDRLVARLPFFQGLRALRAEAEAAARAPRPSAPARPAPKPEAVALDLSGGSLLDRIVEDAQPASEAPDRPRSSVQGDLADFVARAVRSHMVSEPTAEQREVTARVDEVIAATLRVVLHHPRYQALESAWRGVDFLVRRLDTSESMQVYLVDASRDEVVADMNAADVAETSLYRLLRGGSRGESPWSLLVGLYTFEPADAATLSSVAALGRVAGAPWLAAAHPRFMGTDSFGNDPDDWMPASSSAWDALRSSPSASFLSLSLPRFLLRVPYGRYGEECEEMRFEEMGAGAPAHAAFLWGNPAVLGALAIAESVADGSGPASRATVERLPLYVAPVDGEPAATPCAEALLSQRLVEEMVELGLTAIVSPREADSILIPRIQSVAAPARLLSVRVTAS